MSYIQEKKASGGLCDAQCCAYGGVKASGGGGGWVGGGGAECSRSHSPGFTEKKKPTEVNVNQHNPLESLPARD